MMAQQIGLPFLARGRRPAVEIGTRLPDGARAACGPAPRLATAADQHTRRSVKRVEARAHGVRCQLRVAGDPDLAIPVRRANLHAAGGDRAERDGGAAAVASSAPISPAWCWCAASHAAAKSPLRLALGATRTRIVRLLLVENLVLAVPGAICGLALVWLGLPLFWASTSAAAPGRLFLDLSIDRLVIGFSVLAACVSALVFGFMPAFRGSRIDLVSVHERGPVAARRRAEDVSAPRW